MQFDFSFGKVAHAIRGAVQKIPPVYDQIVIPEEALIADNPEVKITEGFGCA